MLLSQYSHDRKVATSAALVLGLQHWQSHSMTWRTSPVSADGRSRFNVLDVIVSHDRNPHRHKLKVEKSDKCSMHKSIHSPRVDFPPPLRVQ